MIARYKLTKSENDLALRLLAGKNLKQCAVDLGVTYETARTFLKTIFQKTGTHRQTELVILMLSLKIEIGPSPADAATDAACPQSAIGCERDPGEASRVAAEPHDAGHTERDRAALREADSAAD